MSNRIKIRKHNQHYLLPSFIVIIIGGAAHQHFSLETTSTSRNKVSIEELHVLSKQMEQEKQTQTTDTIESPLTKNLVLLNSSRSLSGTNINGNLPLTSKNELIVTEDIISLFDYFLFASGEISDTVIQQGIREYLSIQLPEPALGSALEILNNYLAYIEAQESDNSNAIANYYPNDKHFLDGLEGLGQSTYAKKEILQHLSTNLAHIKEIRRDYMGYDVAKAVWLDDEIYDDYTLNRLTILSDQQLSDEEKSTAIEILKEQLPEHIRKSNKGPSSLYSIASSLKQNISTVEAHQINITNFGYDSANRLKKLEEDRKRFNDMYRKYYKEREDILKSGLSNTDRMNAIDSLRLRHFGEQQISRVAAKDLFDKQRY